jgi:hypothetical protein
MGTRALIIAAAGLGLALAAAPSSALAQPLASGEPNATASIVEAPQGVSTQPVSPVSSEQSGNQSNGQIGGQPSVTPGDAAMPPSAAFVPRTPKELVKARYLVHVMEGVLENSVKYAATQMNRRLQAVSPDLLQLSGAARARGFRLDGYGVFFDVEVPAALRQTMGWTMRMMQNDPYVDQAISALRNVASGLEGKQKGDAENALKLIELRVRPNGQPYTPPSDRRNQPAAANVVAANSNPDGRVSSSQQGAQPAGDAALNESPDLTYEMEVRDALVGAMLEYGQTLALQPNEWLTIAARDNQTVIVPGDLTETVTVILRMKGSDLADYKAGRLDEATARSRVEVREF